MNYMWIKTAIEYIPYMIAYESIEFLRKQTDQIVKTPKKEIQTIRSY